MAIALVLLALLLLPLAATIAAAAAAPVFSVPTLGDPAPKLVVELQANLSYVVVVDGTPLLASAPSTVCVAGTQYALASPSVSQASGADGFGAWSGPQVSWTVAGVASAPTVVHTFKQYADTPSLAVVEAAFPQGLDTRGCGLVDEQSTNFPAFSINALQAPSLTYVSWRDVVLSNTVAVKGLKQLQQSGRLDNGPIVAYDAESPQGVSVVWSTLTSHKIVVQTTSASSALVALFSPGRRDQILCLSPACFGDQQGDDYAQQRTEGYGFQTPGNVVIDGQEYATVPLTFAWSATHVDNYVATNTTYPDATYTFHEGNGYVLASPAPGSLPLRVYAKKYDAQHTDYATVATPDGIQWAESNAYTFLFVTGHVLAAPPAVSGDFYALGLSAAIPSIPAGWSYSVALSASYGGITQATYHWGAQLQSYYGTYRLPSVTLSDVGYYTDDGAYYYVWEAFHIPPRPWPAELGLVLVKERLWQQGVPVAYMQLDDWWYNGPFYFGNVKAVVDWHASTSPRLFPNGLNAFADRLNISLQLYTPFWSDKYQSKYNMTESTVFAGTKLVTPKDSYAFFSDYFDFGAEQTGGRFSTFEIDFLDSNFQGSASMFEDVNAADTWYAGLANAALERGIALQFCLPSATDMLQALALPAVVQARASGDYVSEVSNAYQLGGSSLLMGALGVAPSKDTLWTSSPQPPTYSDTKQHNDYTEQPHVQLDAVLATLSLGPVGISDAYNYTDVFLISQAFRCPSDSTLLRPARPASWVHSFFQNRSAGVAAQDVRAAHAQVPTQRGGLPRTPALTSHYVVAWRTSSPATLGPFDLYPAPAPATKLAQRQHVAGPDAAAQLSGCVDGQPAAGTCVQLLCARDGHGDGAPVSGASTTSPSAAASFSCMPPTIAATGTNLSQYSLTAVYEALSNGAFFLGELTKFVHVSPQRFEYVLVDAEHGGKAGLVAGVRGCAGESLTLVAVDAGGITRVAHVTLPTSGFADVPL